MNRAMKLDSERGTILEMGLVAWGGEAWRRIWYRHRLKTQIRYLTEQAVDWIKRGVRW